MGNLLFRATALFPVPFLALAPLYGGHWAFVALFYMTVFAYYADEALMASGGAVSRPGRFDRAVREAVPVVLGLAHLGLLPLAILCLTGSGLGLPEKLVIFAAYALFFGVVSTANAHELIHRRDRFRHTLGKWVFISMLFGHHVSSHLLIHHRHAATPKDPNTARLNENVYRFLRRAWLGSFREGLAAECGRLKRARKSRLHPANPYLIYVLGALAFVALAWVLGGVAGLLIYLFYAFLAQMQLLLSDYVQHYGLERPVRPNGRYEKVTIRHSWNAAHTFSSALMMHAPRHSDHHTKPSRGYSELRTRAADGAPVLPYSLLVMSVIALKPRAWKRLMNPLVADWVRAQDRLPIG